MDSTSALDPLTERTVYENLRQLGCTIVVIAHRLSTIAHADAIAVMAGGRIVEVGSLQQTVRPLGRRLDQRTGATSASSSMFQST